MAIHPATFAAFEDELTKIAGIHPAIRNAAIGAGVGGGLGALASRDGERGRGAAMGAAGGAALGGASHYAVTGAKKFLANRKHKKAIEAYKKKGFVKRLFSRNPAKKK